MKRNNLNETIICDPILDKGRFLSVIVIVFDYLVLRNWLFVTTEDNFNF